MNSGRVLIATDHGGFELKNQIVEFLKSKKVQVLDVGIHELIRVPYSDYSRKIIQNIKQNDKGIIICSTGLGISFGVIKAGIKCSLAFNQYTAAQCRKLGCQVMSFGAKVITVDIAKRMVQQFLQLQ